MTKNNGIGNLLGIGKLRSFAAMMSVVSVRAKKRSVIVWTSAMIVSVVLALIAFEGRKAAARLYRRYVLHLVFNVRCESRYL